MKKINKFEKLIGRWIVPISKDCDNKKELLQLKQSLGHTDTRFAHMKNHKWILVRQLTSEDLKSLDFVKYIATFKYTSIVRLYK